MKIDELREKINEIDDQMLELFKRRMDIAEEIGIYKKENSLPVRDRAREREILFRLTQGLSTDMAGYVKVFFSELFDISSSHQTGKTLADSDISRLVDEAVDTTPKIFPASAVVACQGVEGAFSQLACEKLFSLPSIMYFTNFEGVFQAVAGGLCQYGVLPLENSTAGSVNEVYDLMNKYNFYISRGVRLRVHHTLLAPHGVKLTDVKEIFSHPQALSQCSKFLKTLPNIKITECENTAAAAKHAASSKRRDIAVISSQNCAGLYDLAVLNTDIQDSDSNYTRFICISKKLEIYPGADKTSLMLSISHKPGSLHNILAKFYALSMNLLKLESRPIPGRDFEFKFYFDIEAPVYAPEFKILLSELEYETVSFDYLGSYQEI